MKLYRCFLLLTIWVAAAVSPGFARDLGTLKVLYIGDIGSEREQAFSALLKKNVAVVDVTNRQEFDPETAASYDVVLLDWPQDYLQIGTGPGWGHGSCPLWVPAINGASRQYCWEVRV